MKRSKFLIFMSLLLAIVTVAWGIDQCWAQQSPASVPELQQNPTNVETMQGKPDADEKTNRSKTHESWNGLEQAVPERAKVDPVFRKYLGYYDARMKALNSGTLLSR